MEWEPMDLRTLIAGLDIHSSDASRDLAAVRVCDLTEDSRTAVPGSLFIARAGLSTDGRQYIEAALECGAVAVLTDTAEIELPRNADTVVLVSKDLTRHAALIAERFWGGPASALSIMGCDRDQRQDNGRSFRASAGQGRRGSVRVDRHGGHR